MTNRHDDTRDAIRKLCRDYIEARGGRIRLAQWIRFTALYSAWIRDDLNKNLVRRTSRYAVLRKEVKR